MNKRCKNAAETVAVMQRVCKEYAVSTTLLYEWFFQFKREYVVIEGQPHFGRPSTAQTEDNIAKIRNVSSEDRRRTIDQLEDLSCPAAQFSALSTLICEYEKWQQFRSQRRRLP